MTTTRIHPGHLFLLPLLFLLLQASKAKEGTECSVDEDCRTINGSSCVAGNCTCPDSKPVLVGVPKQNSRYCMTAFNETGGNCTFDQQCVYQNGRCSEEGTCGCETRFTEKGQKCERYAKSAIVPIAVGITIGVAVIGTLCLYLWISRMKGAPDDAK